MEHPTWKHTSGKAASGVICYVLSFSWWKSDSNEHIMGEMNSRPSRATLFLNLLPAGDTQTYISNVFLHPSLDLRFQQDSSWVSLSSAHQPVLYYLFFSNFWWNIQIPYSSVGSTFLQTVEELPYFSSTYLISVPFAFSPWPLPNPCSHGLAPYRHFLAGLPRSNLSGFPHFMII